jgi:hypothetical protein
MTLPGFPEVAVLRSHDAWWVVAANIALIAAVVAALV